MAVQTAVNRKVAGSNPALGAIRKVPRGAQTGFETQGDRKVDGSIPLSSANTPL